MPRLFLSRNIEEAGQVGRRGQGVFQAFFFMCNYSGRALGSFLVGPLGAVAGESALWALCVANFSVRRPLRPLWRHGV
jgi:hypothetical protein